MGCPTASRVTEALSDDSLEDEIFRTARWLDRLADRFENLLDERDRRGRVQVALTQAAYAFMADREAVQRDQVAL